LGLDQSGRIGPDFSRPACARETGSGEGAVAIEKPMELRDALSGESEDEVGSRLSHRAAKCTLTVRLEDDQNAARVELDELLGFHLKSSPVQLKRSGPGGELPRSPADDHLRRLLPRRHHIRAEKRCHGFEIAH
jgi:hypothetical protein